MKKVKTKIILLIIFLLLTGLVCDLGRTTFSLEAKQIKTFDENGGIQTVVDYDFPLHYKLIGIMATFCYSLGFAIFITSFITNKIEGELKKKKENEFEELRRIKEEELDSLRKSINIDVFDSLFKTLVPEELFNVIKHQIIENKIIREEAKWYLDFEKDENGKLTLKQTFKYTLRNTSQQEITNPVKMQVGMENGVISELKSAKCRMDNKEVFCYIPENDETTKDVKITPISEEAYQKIIEFSIKIPPGKSVEATTVLIDTYEKDEIHNQYISRYPIINGTLVVRHPKDYGFKLFSAMSNKLQPDIIEDDRKTFELKGAVLPFQSFIYYLEKGAT